MDNIKVRIIPQQYNPNSFKQEKYAPDISFNPREDANGDWVITENEFQTAQIERPDLFIQYEWLIDLVQTDWFPPTTWDPLMEEWVTN